MDTDRADVFKIRGYVKRLMGDAEGARQDAEAGRLRFQRGEFEETVIDFRRLWLPPEQPINNLG